MRTRVRAVDLGLVLLCNCLLWSVYVLFSVRLEVEFANLGAGYDLKFCSLFSALCSPPVLFTVLARHRGPGNRCGCGTVAPAASELALVSALALVLTLVNLPQPKPDDPLPSILRSKLPLRSFAGSKVARLGFSLER